MIIKFWEKEKSIPATGIKKYAPRRTPALSAIAVRQYLLFARVCIIMFFSTIRNKLFYHRKKHRGCRFCVAFLCPLALILPASAFLCGCRASMEPVTQSGFYFNTVISLTVYGSHADDAMAEAFTLCEHYENLWSKTVAGSDIWNINHADGKPVKVDPKTADLLNTALYWAEKTDGLIDPTVTPLSDLWNFTGDPKGPVPAQEEIDALLPHVNYQNVRISENTVALTDPKAQIDVGFLAKGYIADCLKELFLEKDVTSALINLGGNVLAVGSKPDGSAFRTGIKMPFGKDGELAGIVSLSDHSLVSSGSYERCFEQDGRLYHHILNPSTGYPADTGLSGVTILSDSSTDGDALSTSCFLLGLDQGMELIESLPGTEAMFITTDGQIYKTDGFPD